jgi:hypothetical protein
MPLHMIMGERPHDTSGGLVLSHLLNSANLFIHNHFWLTVRFPAMAPGTLYYNFCLPHASLWVPLLQPEPTNGSGSAKTWRPRRPAMAAGLTDHVSILVRPPIHQCGMKPAHRGQESLEAHPVFLWSKKASSR